MPTVASAKVGRLTTSNSSLYPKSYSLRYTSHMSHFQTLSIPTSFHYPLSAWQIGDTQSKKFVVLMPGFLDSKDYPHLKELGKKLAENDWLAIGFDALGVWESKAPIELYSMTNWLSELEQLIAWSKKQYPSIQTVVLMGHSMGGKLSLHYAATHPEIKAIVSIMGGPDFVRAETYQRRKAQWKSEWIHTSRRDAPEDPQRVVEFALPFIFVEDSEKHILSKICTQISSPTLLIAAQDDQIVPAIQMKEISKMLPDDRVELTVFPNMTHDYRKTPTDIVRVNQAILHFLEKNT